MLKILQARLQQYMNYELPDVQVGFRKGRGTKIKLPTSAGSSKKQESSRKTLISDRKLVAAGYGFYQFAAVTSVVSDSVWPRRQQPTRLPRPWDSPGKNTGVGCYFLLQCRKVESESEVAQSCPTLHDPMDCSLPGSSIHGIHQARALEWDAIAFSNLVNL